MELVLVLGIPGGQIEDRLRVRKRVLALEVPHVVLEGVVHGLRLRGPRPLQTRQPLQVPEDGGLAASSWRQVCHWVKAGVEEEEEDAWVPVVRTA